MPRFLSLIWIIALGGAFASSQELDKFVLALIEAWQLHSPTIIVGYDDLPDFCLSRQWLLCLSNVMDTNEVVDYLVNGHKRQDGVLLVGNQGHEDLLNKVANESDLNGSLFTRNYPFFMSISYKNNIKLRLDLNILFYEDKGEANYQLYDIFAVKGGPPITLEVGKWNSRSGIKLQKSKNRWDRRTDLGGATFINAFGFNPRYSEPIKDKHNNTVGTKGYVQDMLFYVTDKLNLTIETMQLP